MASLVFTSSNTASPELIVLDRERGAQPSHHVRTHAYQHSGLDTPGFAAAAARLSSEGSVIYAFRLADGIIKIGWTGNLPGRTRYFRSMYGLGEFLGFTFGTREQELELHRTLREHRARGREYYRPAQPVIDLVNQWRAELGRPPI